MVLTFTTPAVVATRISLDTWRTPKYTPQSNFLWGAVLAGRCKTFSPNPQIGRDARLPLTASNPVLPSGLTL
eukprot:6996755-Heterocapsa_arctica.AAC.1